MFHRSSVNKAILSS
jgi:hypothetical protein